MPDSLQNLSGIMIDGHKFEDYATKSIEGVTVKYNDLHQSTDLDEPFKATNQVYTDRLHSVLEAGRSLSKERFPDDTILTAALNKIGNIENIKEKLSDKDPGDKTQHKEALEIIVKTTRKIADLLREAEKRLYVASKEEVNVETDWVKILQKTEYQQISKTHKDTIVNVYPDGDGGYMISYAKPITTISSLSRKGEPLNEGEPIKLPNFWKSISTHVNKDGNELSRRTLFRSSSLSPREEKNKEERMKKAEEIAKFEMGEYVIDKLKENIRDNIKTKKGTESHPNLSTEQIKSCFQFDFLSMSLQSSIFTETKAVSEGAKTYEKITQQGLSGGFELLDYHKEAMKKLLPEIKNINAYPLKVKPNVVFFNLGCNVLRGNDFSGVQGELNKKAKRALQVKVHDSLNTKENENNEDIKELKKILLEKNPVGSKQIKALERKLKNQDSSLDPKTKKTIELFLNFCYLNKGRQNLSVIDHVKNRSIDNYLKQEAVMALGEDLGFVVKGNCQSGKDRTGLLFAMTEATQIYRDKKNKENIIKDKNEIWETLLPNTTKHTSGRVIVNVNCPGANGLQGQVYNVITPSGFKESIDAQRQDRASKLHKAPYSKNDKKIYNNKKFLDEEKNAILVQDRSRVSNTSSLGTRESVQNKSDSSHLSVTITNHSQVQPRVNEQPVLNAFEQFKSPNSYFSRLETSFKDTDWKVQTKQNHEIEISNPANESIKFVHTPDSFEVSTHSINEEATSALYKASAAVLESDKQSSYEISMTSDYDWETQLERMYESGMNLNNISSLKVDGVERIQEVKAKIPQIENKARVQANASESSINNRIKMQ